MSNDLMTVSDRYDAVVGELDAVEEYRLRLLGQADLLKALVDAGQGDIQVPYVNYESPLPDAGSAAGGDDDGTAAHGNE